MPICPITGLSFEHHELEKRHYERFGLPVPNIHPIARRIQKLAFVNAWDLYWATDARTGKKILSWYDPAEHPVIYDRTYWMSNDFDARDCGRSFDFSRSFFDQYFEMVATIPKPNLVSVASENVDYCNNIINSKNSYLSFNVFACDNMIYSARVFESRDSINLYNSRKCELCYACNQCTDCHSISWSEFCVNCTSSQFLSNCFDCLYCYQCVNLRHKSYCIQNKQYTKEEYERRMHEIDLGSWDAFRKEESAWKAFLESQPLQAQHNVNCEDSIGILLKNCKSCYQCFALTNAEHCFAGWGNHQIENSDSSGEDAEYNTSTQGIVSSQRTAHCLMMERSFDILYSQFIFQSNNCFGCYGLKKASYCIMNTQYAPAEYDALKEKIIAHMKEDGEWGQYFPVRYAPFPYERTLARAITSTEFDDNPEMMKMFEFRFDERTDSNIRPDGHQASELPDHCDDADEILTKLTFLCHESGRPYNITKQELAFYKKHRVPLPRISWRTAIEHHYPTFYPSPHATRCAECGCSMYSYLRPDKTTRRKLCDTCFMALTG
ncbi:hypothetical protein HY732_04395 [Candidatus Uhrbacteria bacterium]|nr:hypothetical protein [Candidatus Uhrbacteria bacterium]